MEHPLVGNLDHLTEDELSAKVNELSSKLTIAMRTGNGHLCNQIRMAMESYQIKYREKLEDSYKKQMDGRNFEDKINIK
jgi:hypothetical protein